MNTEIEPKKSDPFDAKPVIKYAAQQAVKTGKDRYVLVRAVKWVSATKPPGPQWSHWKVDHMANLYAHLGGRDVTEYNYQKTEGRHAAQPQ